MQRWNTHLDPTVSKTYWTKDEDEKVQNASKNLIRMCLMQYFTNLFFSDRWQN